MAQPIALSLTPSVARRQLESLLVREAWEGGVDEIVLALHEALVNASRHAGGALRAEAVADGSSLLIEVWDRGTGFDLASYARRPPDPMAERGRGLWLISRIASECDVRREDEVVVLSMRFERPEVGARRRPA